MQRLREAAEKAKCELSSAAQVRVKVDSKEEIKFNSYLDGYQFTLFNNGCSRTKTYDL
jgi:molecular chaperone DnaK (HSP70)